MWADNLFCKKNLSCVLFGNETDIFVIVLPCASFGFSLDPFQFVIVSK